MLRRGAIVLAWAGLGLWGIQGCGGFLDPITAHGTGGAAAGEASGGSGGTGGGGGNGAVAGGSATGGDSSCPSECVLQPDGTGWVEGPPCCPVKGAWYYYDDGFTEQLLPVPPVRSVTPPESGENRLCTKGTTAALSDAGFANVWGAGIGLWLNQVTDVEIHNPIGLLPRMPIGFRFSLSGTLGSNGLRVNFPYTDSDTVPHFVTVLQPGALNVHIANAQQGTWVPNPTAVDPTRVVAIQFAIPAGSEAIAFDFCVNTLTALFQP
jgi:hypothetical protein